ncbi:hypothetical protein ABPG74_022249 [Tetrahymena malaccensis]
MYNQPNDLQSNYGNQQNFQRQNDDPMKEIKKNYGEYLRQQIKFNEEKKKQEKFGGPASRQQDDYYKMNDISNQQYQIPQEKQGYLRNRNDSNSDQISNKSPNGKVYGEYLKKQMDEKRNNANVNTDFKQQKIQELQERMAARNDNPYGKGGSGAPLIGKNGEIISSRKPDTSLVQYDYLGGKNQDSSNSITTSQPSYSLGRQQYASQQQSMHESLANKINEKLHFKSKDQSYLDKKDFYRENINYNIEQSILTGAKNNYNEKDSLKPVQSDNATNFRRNNKRLIDSENQNEADFLRKEKQKQEISNALQEQIMLKDRKKQQEKEREREEELKIEERVKKEREQIERQLKEEEEKKKKKAADIIQENEDLKKQKKNKIIPYHLDEGTPQKSKDYQKPQMQKQNTFDNSGLSKNNINNYNNSQPSQQLNNTNNIMDFQTIFTNYQQPNFNIYNAQNQNYAQQLQQNSSKNMYSSIPYNYSPNNDILSNTFHLQRMALNSQEMRSRDIAPEIDNMKQQIQDQYKNLQLDVHRAKLENIQAIDDRNKYGTASRQQINPYTIDYSDFNTYSNNNNNLNNYGNQYNQNMYRQQYTKSRESTGYQSQRRQVSSADNNQLNVIQNKPTAYDRQEEYNIQSLDAESKMIPMDLIDHLKQKDKLTMSQLINYDQDYSQNTIINNQAEQDLNPNTKIWDIPTMNSDITKDIDKILSHQSHQIQQTVMMQQKEEELMRQKYSSQSQHRTKIKSETTFNMAAKGILDQTGYSHHSNNRNEESNPKRINQNQFQNNNFEENNQNFNTTNQFQKENYYGEQNNNLQNLNMSDLQLKFERENDINRKQGNQDEPQQQQQNRDAYQNRDQLFDYKRDHEYDQQENQDEDSDEIKKQKALREIRERFHLSTVNEDFNEKTRQLSTILETGKYQDNKELYESLRNVEHPDFYKLDELIKQFKSSHIQNNDKYN